MADRKTQPSLLRRSFEQEFGASVSHSSNHFAWYGTTKRFETLSQTFVETELGDVVLAEECCAGWL